MKLMILSILLLLNTSSILAWTYSPKNLKQASINKHGIHLGADFSKDRSSRVKFRTCTITNEYLKEHQISKIDLLSAIKRKELEFTCNLKDKEKLHTHDVILYIEANI